LELRDHKFSKISQGNFLFLDLYVTRHGKPLNGIVKIELLCKDLTVSSLRADAEEGFLKVKFDTKDYRGPFVIILTTRDRESDSLLISGVLPQEFMTAGMGHSFEISLHNLQGMEDSTRGIYYRRIEEKEKFFRLEEVSTSSGKIKLLEEFNKIQIVVINPIDGESTIYNFNDIKKDDLLDFEIYPPYSFIHLAFWKEKPFESWGIVLKPLQIKGLLKIKNNAYTGEELKIQIETDKPSSCLLIVSNKKPENFNPKKQLARDIYFNIKENSFNLHDGFIGTENLFCDYSVKNKKPFRPPVNISLFADSEEMEIIYSEVFPVDKVMEKTLLLPHKPGKWYVSSYILNDLDCLELCEEVLVREISITIDFDVPQIMGYGEKISGRIYFDTSEEAKLFINTPTDYFEGEVSGSGMTEFELLSPGDIRGELSFGSKKDIITHTICPAGMEKVILSSINLLSRGDIIEGDNLLIYPPNSLLLQLIRSMESFSFDSSEILSSKLSAMAIEYRLILSGVLSGDQKELEEKIYANLQILKKFFKEGFFSLWGEEPSVEVTVKVLTNMLSYQGLHFVSADRIIQSASKSLLERGIKSYPLTLLSSEFTPPSTRNINPILTYLYGPKLLRQQLVSLIKILAIKSHNFYYWKGDDFWGGTLEATCHALKVMHRAGEKEIFQKALNFIFTNIKNGTLNSTSDTLSLVELLSEVFLPSGSRAIVNGVETSFNDIFPVRGKVEVIEKNLIVRSDREEIVNYLEKQGEISFSIEVSSSHVIIGEILTIIIKPETRTLCPIARIFLPGNIDLLDLTPGIQYINLPVKGSTLEINALAVRNGTGKIRVFLEDFYRPDRTGVSESVEIVVGET
ncbi:MAG TPA: hypothetical protein PL110_18790, partial [Candidatus Eremiobacteraeota bacterium]|nr:hypothetical protein [Candidatus Eremiobacteraeota bacterium]